MKTIPNHPAISNLLVKASANVVFRSKLLANPSTALAELQLPPEDFELLAGIQASTLPEYARQVKEKLISTAQQPPPPWRFSPDSNGYGNL